MGSTTSPSLITVGNASVAVWNYGDPRGRPVMAFHGTPSCGAGFSWADEAARQRGLRLIAPDRPGVGLSSPRSGWTVSEYPAMVDALADALGVSRYAVMGYSGGGPYAAACAVMAGDRIRCAAICAGMGQIGDGWAKGGEFEKTDAQMLDLAVRRPRRAGFILGIAARAARLAPKGTMRSLSKQMSESDRQVLGRLGPPTEAMRQLFTAAFAVGAGGAVADYAALARPWGVEVAPTEVPVSIWHGGDDPMVPLSHSQILARRFGGVPLTVWPGEGHLAVVTHIGDVLDWIASR